MSIIGSSYSNDKNPYLVMKHHRKELCGRPLQTTLCLHILVQNQDSWTQFIVATKPTTSKQVKCVKLMFEMS